MRKLLRESGVEFEEVDYTVDRLSKTKLRELVQKTGLEPREMLRTREAVYKKLNLANPDIGDAEILNAKVLLELHINVIGRRPSLEAEFDSAPPSPFVPPCGRHGPIS